jgi:hypothetical protein
MPGVLPREWTDGPVDGRGREVSGRTGVERLDP